MREAERDDEGYCTVAEVVVVVVWEFWEAVRAKQVCG
jgi:hypothetical protein